MERDDREFGKLATKKLFENERVRIWEMRLAPGEKTDLHEHDNDYVMVQVSGDKWGAVFEADSADPWNNAGREIELDVVPGFAMFARKGGKETAINVGNEPWHQIIVELLD